MDSDILTGDALRAFESIFMDTFSHQVIMSQMSLSFGDVAGFTGVADYQVGLTPSFSDLLTWYTHAVGKRFHTYDVFDLSL